MWTGEEVLFVGGSRFACPPNADCVAPDEPPFAEGAALDPGTGEWRRIAPAPVPVLQGSSAVLGGDVYLLVRSGFGDGDPAFLRYRVAGDEWERLEAPPAPAASYALVVADETMVAVGGSDERGDIRDHRFDRNTGTWHELPESPLGAGFDRTMS